MKNIYYYIVRFIARCAVYLFYIPVEVNGQDNIPKDSSHIIFAPNHQSAYLDAILVAVFSSKPIYFLTRADVFTFPFKYILRSLNMMPVYRIRDGYKSLSKNEAVFNTCRELVRSGKPILLFPEASQLLVHYLRPLTSGLSRIAYLSQEDFDKDIYIVPVGLNYFDQLRSGSKLTVNFAKAINVRELFQEHPDRKSRIDAIRNATSQALYESMLIPDNDESYKSKLEYLNRNNFSYNFQELRERIRNGEDPQKAEKIWAMYFFRSIFEFVNLPYFILEFLIIKIFVADKTFHASIRHSLVMFVLPIYFIISYLLVSSSMGTAFALKFLLLQFICYYLRTYLQRFL